MSDMTNDADVVGKPDRDSRNIALFAAYTGGDSPSEYQILASLESVYPGSHAERRLFVFSCGRPFMFRVKSFEGSATEGKAL